MTKVKKGDFIEVDYTGIIKEGNLVFDTTDIEVAKANNMDSSQMSFNPVKICLGQGQLLEGLEKELEGKETEKDLTVELDSEKAFGKKDAKFIKMIPLSVFRKQGIDPRPGMQVNVDNSIGIIKTAAGGRCLVDFNHPLSGKEIIYKVKILKIITDDAEKIKSILNLSLRLDAEVAVKDNEAEIKLKQELPKPIQDNINKKLKELIPSLKKIKYKADKVTPSTKK